MGAGAGHLLKTTNKICKMEKWFQINTKGSFCQHSETEDPLCHQCIWISVQPRGKFALSRCERPNTLVVDPLPEWPSNRNGKWLTVTVGDKGTLGLQMFGPMTDGCGIGTGSGGMASAPAWCHLHPSASPHLHNTLHNGADRVGYSGHGGCVHKGDDSALRHLQVLQKSSSTSAFLLKQKDCGYIVCCIRQTNRHTHLQSNCVFYQCAYAYGLKRQS